MIHGFIFDLDGTLINSLADLAGSTNQVLSEKSLPTHPDESYKTFVGDGAHNLLKRAMAPCEPSEAELDEAVHRFKAIYETRWDKETDLYPGVPEMLDQLQAQQVPFGVLSNKPHSFVQQCLARFLGSWSFQGVIGQRDGIPIKPDPAGALEIAQLMKLPPENVAFVGDSNTDIRTALAAGNYPVGVAWGFRTTTELREAGARTIADAPSDLLRLLGDGE